MSGRSVGHRARNWIHRITLVVYPYIIKVIPNFRAAHYTYILFMTFFMSIIIYPLLLFKYIDILFLTAGALTQAGLNTINLNQLLLAQQILVYVMTTLTTPIFIHGLLLFIRLYWFERHFDNIKEKSKLDFKMRRSATLAARTQTEDGFRAARTMTNTRTNQGLKYEGVGAASGEITANNESTEKSSTIEKQASSNPGLTSSEQSKATSGLEHEESTPAGTHRHSTEEADPADLSPLSPAADGIKFGELPHPAKRARVQEVDPSDMYKSIALLQQKKRRDSGIDEVLVIKSPNEIERDTNTPIFTLREGQQLEGGGATKWRINPLEKGKRRWDALKKTISNNPVHGRRRTLLKDFDDENGENGENGENEDDTDSIDSEMARRTSVHSEGAAEDSEIDGSIHSYNYSEDEEEDEGRLDAGSGHGPKKSLFEEAAAGDLKTKFAREPTIDRAKRQQRSAGRRPLRKWRTPAIGRFGSRTTSDRSGHSDVDDEESNFSADTSNLTRVMSTNYLSWTPTIGRNSTFVHLTDDQKAELGGVEYRAIKLLTKIMICYYVGFHLIAFAFFVGFINVGASAGYAEEMRGLGFSPTWWGIYTAQSVFNDLGLTLTPNSMMSFSRSVYILVVASFFIVIGNTGFPVFLRFIIWVMFKLARPLSSYKESLGFLLDHPRRCFTMLFPLIPTWWLFFILIVLNSTDLVLFIILDLNNRYLQSIPVGYRILDGLFQAFSTRTAGFSVIDLALLHPAVQVSYMIMMYISVLPLAISIRRTNVYEEQSLGVYLKGEENNQDIEKNTKSFVGSHLRNQLSFDLWFIFLGLFIICIAEGSKIETGDQRFSVFAILFEIISAYGTVGLSLGYPDIDQSLSGKFTTLSKLVVVAMMIRGRHRGLPYALDRAIMLPSADMHKRDLVQEVRASQRAGTISAEPTANTFTDAQSGGLANRLRKTISRKAKEYRHHSLFPAPTRLPDELNELHEMRTMSRGQ